MLELKTFYEQFLYWKERTTLRMRKSVCECVCVRVCVWVCVRVFVCESERVRE